MRQLIAANWKMHGDLSWDSKPQQLAQLLSKDTHERAIVLICPPLSMLPALVMARADASVSLGAQNCHSEVSGAYTGDVSAQMVAELGASHVILGHSERRAMSGETDSLVRDKAVAAHTAGLISIICIGESLDQRESGQQNAIVKAQLEGSLPVSATSFNTVIAYEPIWAIGTGKVPSSEQIKAMHTVIREALRERFGVSSANEMALLYGGSVKPANAADILTIENVDGALVGGASLDMESFAQIANCARPRVARA